MATRTRRRRYRIVRLFHPVQRLRHPRVRVSRVVKPVKQPIDAPKVAPGESASTHVTNTTTDGASACKVEKIEKVATFPSTHNPYDHLISQLPAMFDHIPNLVAPYPPIEHQVSATTQSPYVWLTGAVPSRHWFHNTVASTTSPTRTPQHTAWQSLPGQNYRQPRFGQQQTTTATPIPTHPTTPNSAWLYSQLDTLAHRMEMSVPALLKALTHPQSVPLFLQDSTVQNIGQCLAHYPINTDTTFVNGLTRQQFIAHALTEEDIGYHPHLIAAVLPYLDPIASHTLTGDEAHTLVQRLSSGGQHVVVQIRVCDQPLVIDIVHDEVQVFRDSLVPTLMTSTECLHRLHTGLQGIDLRTTLECQVYALPNTLEDIIVTAVAHHQPHWQAIEAQPLFYGENAL